MMIREIVKEARKFEGYPSFPIEKVTGFFEKCEALGLTFNRAVRKYIEKKIPFSFEEKPHLSEIFEARTKDGETVFSVPMRN